MTAGVYVAGIWLTSWTRTKRREQRLSLILDLKPTWLSLNIESDKMMEYAGFCASVERMTRFRYRVGSSLRRVMLRGCS